MTKNLKINAQKRKIIGKKVRQIRQEEKLPVVVYGKGKKSQSLIVDQKDFLKIYKEAGRTTLVDLSIDDKVSFKTLIHDIQKHPVTDEILHIDFYQVKMDEKIKTEVPIVFEGISKAVDEKDANLVKNKDIIEIEALPNDLIHEIKVDISPLENYDDAIYIKDLKVPQNVEIIGESDEIVVLAQEPISEEELEKMEEEAAVDSEKAQIEKIEEEVEAEKEKEGETEEGPEAGTKEESIKEKTPEKNKEK